ncbi:glutathione S-transferase family protein [Stenotrophomonas maltophilia]|nr:glutathione S-transferase family protein [Stenotrophomonas maltophilia]
MGMLVDGVWQPGNGPQAPADGQYRRASSTFRHWITPDGLPGPAGQAAFKAEAGRYRLYVSLACPWAHRAIIVRALKGLDDVVSMSVVHWRLGENGWGFEPGAKVTPDPEIGAEHLFQLYAKADPQMTGKVTVPVLWDRQTQTIVNNESGEIIRILDSAFSGLGARGDCLYPEGLRASIDAINDRIYRTVNNGVYRAGFATTQAAYEEAVYPLFETLDWLDQYLQGNDWLVANTFTEADVRLFTTLIRFDSVYFGHFKCNIRRVADYHGLHQFVGRMMARPEIAATVDFEHIKRHCYEGHKHINPNGLVPVGPARPY